MVLTLFMSALFVAYGFFDHGSHMPKMRQRYLGTYIFIDKYFKEDNRKDENLKRFLETNDFEIIKDIQLQKRLFKEGHRIIDKQGRHIEFEVIRIKKEHYMYIKKAHFELLLVDTYEHPFPFYLLWWYGLSLVFVVLFYFWITKNLRPLKELQEDIQRIGEGDLSISLKRKEDDEIAEVANEFDNALRKIEALVNSRQLFLRTIMHELKTPIAKGRIVTELLKDRRNQEKYEIIFQRLELLIEEFSQIEQMLSSRYTLNMNEYNVYDIVDQAIELLILDEKTVQEKINIEVKNHFSLHTDFNFLSLAIKNLLDNGLKYASNHKIKVVIDSNSIVVINKGEPLNAEIENFFQPFHNQTHKTKGGLGLGLYIVKSISEKLELDFEYYYLKQELHSSYNRGEHYFKISRK